MPTRIFAITAARETVTLDNEGRAEVSFTASNTGPKSIAGRVKLVLVGATKAAWLSLEGEQERNFAKGEAHQLTVRIAVPPGTPVGKYSFRLNIISVENPDDEFTEGPSVSFEVKELAVAQAPARKFPWWIVAVAAVVVLGGGLITWLLIPQKVTMPEVVGKSLEEAEKSLKDANLKLVKETKVSGKQKPGFVIEQNPDPKKEKSVRVGSEVKLVVEVAPTTVAVPPVVGKPTSEAKDLLKDRDLAYEEADKRITGKVSPGRVVEQNPAEGAKVRPGTKVAVIVEAESVEVPDVIGVPADKVGPIFEVKKLQYSVIGRPIITGKVTVGTIAHQSPEKDQRVPVGTRVELAAEGPSVLVPDVRGLVVNEALSKLEMEHLYATLDTRGQTIGKETLVGSQSPEPRTRVAPYSMVTLRPK